MPSRNGQLSGPKIVSIYRPDCVHCRRSWSKTVVPTVEHIVAKADGGGSATHNLTLACRRCNSQRGDIPFEMFYDGYVQGHGGIDTAVKVRGKRRWYHGDVFKWF